MSSYRIGVSDDAWTGQADAVLKRLENVDDLIDQLAEDTVLPILGRHYRASGLKERTGAMFSAVTRIGSPGNIFQKTAMGFVVGIDYAVIPYAQYIIEGAKPHDIPGAFGRPLPFGIGGRFAGKFHPGNAPHDIYFLSPDELQQVEADLTVLLTKAN